MPSRSYPARVSEREGSGRRYEIMQKFIEGVRNKELKRNFALMFGQEQYVEALPTTEALRFNVQQCLRLRGSSLSENYPTPLQHQPTNKIK